MKIRIIAVIGLAFVSLALVTLTSSPASSLSIDAKAKISCDDGGKVCAIISAARKTVASKLVVLSLKDNRARILWEKNTQNWYNIGISLIREWSGGKYAIVLEGGHDHHRIQIYHEDGREILDRPLDQFVPKDVKSDWKAMHRITPKEWDSYQKFDWDLCRGRLLAFFNRREIKADGVPDGYEVVVNHCGLVKNQPTLFEMSFDLATGKLWNTSKKELKGTDQKK